jgi:hypothetical protein
MRSPTVCRGKRGAVKGWQGWGGRKGPHSSHHRKRKTRPNRTHPVHRRASAGPQAIHRARRNGASTTSAKQHPLHVPPPTHTHTYTHARATATPLPYRPVQSPAHLVPQKLLARPPQLCGVRLQILSASSGAGNLLPVFQDGPDDVVLWQPSGVRCTAIGGGEGVLGGGGGRGRCWHNGMRGAGLSLHTSCAGDTGANVHTNTTSLHLLSGHGAGGTLTAAVCRARHPLRSPHPRRSVTHPWSRRRPGTAPSPGSWQG